MGKTSKFNKQKSDEKSIARERIIHLFNEAKSADEEYADKYVQMARKISSRFKVRVPKEFSTLFCRKCSSYLSPKRSRTRIRKGVIIKYCLKCGNYRRYKLK
jgi:ribonuclease P protein subunit RPR2